MEIDINKVEYIKTIDGRVFLNDGVQGQDMEYKEGFFYCENKTIASGNKYTSKEIVPLSGVQRIAYYETVEKV